MAADMIDLSHIHTWRVQALGHLEHCIEARHGIEAGRGDYPRTGEPIGLVKLAYAGGVAQMLDPSATSCAAFERLCAGVREARAGSESSRTVRGHGAPCYATGCAMAKLVNSSDWSPKASPKGRTVGR